MVVDGMKRGANDSFEKEGETDVVDERDFGGGGVGFVLQGEREEEGGREGGRRSMSSSASNELSSLDLESNSGNIKLTMYFNTSLNLDMILR